MNIFMLIVEKAKMKKKRPGMVHFSPNAATTFEKSGFSFNVLNGPFPASSNFILSFQYSTVDCKQMFYIKFCQRLDSNRGHLVSETTALPTEPQQLPGFSVIWYSPYVWIRRLGTLIGFGRIGLFLHYKNVRK